MLLALRVLWCILLSVHSAQEGWRRFIGRRLCSTFRECRGRAVKLYFAYYFRTEHLRCSSWSFDCVPRSAFVFRCFARRSCASALCSTCCASGCAILSSSALPALLSHGKAFYSELTQTKQASSPRPRNFKERTRQPRRKLPSNL